MKLHEYQSKSFFKHYGIPIPAGHVTSIAREAKHIAEEVGLPVVVKAQVLVEGRGMAGGIRLAKTSQEAEEFASEILSTRIHGLPVRKVLIDEALSIEKEYFALITFDRSRKKPLLMMYESGTIYIETAANALYDNLERIYIDPLIGLQRFQIRQLAYRLDFPEKYMRGLTDMCMGMWHLFCDLDARVVAINPLAITSDQRILALDGKINLDRNARFRHDELADFHDHVSSEYGELEAQKYGLDYLKFEGDIGMFSNGAGLTMATLDMIREKGGNPANFLDLGSGVNVGKIAAAFDILLNDVNVRTILVNIYGGITRCEEIAEGMLEALAKHGNRVPMVVHFGGATAEIGYQILAEAPVTLVYDMEKAIETAVAVAGGKS